MKLLFKIISYFLVRSGALIIFIFLIQINKSHAQCYTRITKDNGSSLTEYGRSVDINGDRFAVGSDNVVYIYDWNGTEWIESIISPTDGIVGGFGISVSLDGNRCIVGAFQDDSNGRNAGAAYIFEYNGLFWNEVKLLASDGGIDHQFGWSVDIKGDRAIVGARSYYENNTSGNALGSAYIYDWNGSEWIETKILASDGKGGDFFGSSVSIDGNNALIGASGSDDNGSSSGLVYAYDWDGTNWNESKLFASNGSSGDFFGYTLAMDNNWAIIGARGHNERKGAAYIYAYSGTRWVQVKELVASDGKEGDQFGYSVSVSGDNFIVGAANAINDGVFSGYTFKWDGTKFIESKLSSSDIDLFSFYGRAVAISEERAILGARLIDNGDFIGAVYIFEEKLWFEDFDGDTFGNQEVFAFSCEQPEGFVSNSEDCDDTDAEINPAAEEIPENDIDENCDGMIGTTSTDQIINNKYIIVYPNPISDHIKIKSNLNKELMFNIYNSVGNKLLTGSTRDFIDASILPQGIYMLLLEDSTHTIKISKKIVKL